MMSSHFTLQELTADKSRLDEVNSVAVQLIGEGHSGEHIIQEHQASLNTRSTYIIFYIGEGLFEVSGVLAVVTLGIELVLCHGQFTQHRRHAITRALEYKQLQLIWSLGSWYALHSQANEPVYRSCGFGDRHQIG